MLENYPSPSFYEKLSKHASVSVDVGPTLVSQLLAGGLDAAIVYRSNIMADKKAMSELMVVEIDKSVSNSVATQPWAISRTTRFPNLMNRMFLWIQRDQIRKKFEESGFQLFDESVQLPTN